MRKSRKEWTETETSWLKANHSNLTNKEIAEHLGCNVNQVNVRVRQLSLNKFNKYETLKNSLANINLPQTAYLLGYLWADGYVRKKKPYQVSLAIATKDADEIRSIVLKTGEWCETLNRANTSGGRNNAALCKFFLTNKDISFWFSSMGFHSKSNESPRHLIGFIPEKLRHYFWRGYFDGDGCICSISNGGALCVSFTSSEDQDWSLLSETIKALGIHFKIAKNVKERGSNSVLRIWRKKDVFKIMSYLYNGEKFGLKRKLFKYQTHAPMLGLPLINEESSDMSDDFVKKAELIEKRRKNTSSPIELGAVDSGAE